MDEGIEPSELLLASLGIYPFITGNINKIRKYHLDDAESIPRQIERLARAVVNGERLPMPKTDMDYHGMLDDLTAGVTAQTILKVQEAFPANLGTEASIASIAASRVASELLAYIPRSEHETLSGVTPLAPSDTRIWRFFAVTDVLDDPMTVFALMSNAALLKSQASAVHAIYPTLTTAISAALMANIQRAKANKKSFELSPRAEYGIRVWSGQPPIPKDQLVQAQANAQTMQAGKDMAKSGAQESMNPNRPSDRTKFDATQSQRTEQGL